MSRSFNERVEGKAMQDIWQTFASKLLGPKELRQFTNAAAHTQTEFHNRVILSQAFRPDLGIHLGISTAEDVPGRHHREAEFAVENPETFAACTYFTNPMELCTPTINEDGKEVWVRPMERVTFGLYQVMTYEFDENNVEFFKKQLAWCRSSTTGKPLDTPMGDLYRACSQWVDFEGITVAWSGNKSFHIHVVFNTAHATTMGIQNHIRSGLMAHWRRLLDTIMTTLEPGCNPDLGMDQPEKFRRIPNGNRRLTKPNILGMPAGTDVPQLTIWEKYRDRAPKGAAISFFDPTLFVQSFTQSSRTSKMLTFMPSHDELDFCRAKMSAIYGNGQFPEFHDFTYHKGTLRAHFTNHYGDRKPSSYMDVEYRTVNINGSNPMGLTPTTSPKLPKPLGEMMVEWLNEYTVFSSRKRSPEEKRFAETVVDTKTAVAAIESILLTTIRDNHYSFVCAPEGISKTTGLFKNHNKINLWLEANDTPRVMYAFADYESAHEKAEDFNKVQGKNGFIGVVLDSFDRAYSKACAKLKVAPLTLTDALQNNFPNLWTAMERLQPDVRNELFDRHQALWSTIGTLKPVFFTVHAVAHRWHLNSPSRLMWAPSFYMTGMDQTERNKLCKAELSIGLLIHDEIKAESLVAAYRAETILWVQDMMEADRDVWFTQTNITEKLESYLAYIATSGKPVINGQPADIDFEAVQDIVGMHGHDWDYVITQDSGEYGGQETGPYAERIHQPWCILERTWPSEVAKKVVVLTTESVPLTLARKGHHVDWTIFDLDTPHIKMDSVETHAVRGVTGNNLTSMVAGWKKSNPNLFVISNKVAHISQTMTHARARGSNALMGKEIMQTMTFMTPDEFEYLEALNAWTGSDCLIRHRHIDEFNQTAGRNLGFRKRAGAHHILLVNQRLFSLLVGEPKARARYEMKVMVSPHARRLANNMMSQKPRKYDNSGATEEMKTNMAAVRARLLQSQSKGVFK